MPFQLLRQKIEQGPSIEGFRDICDLLEYWNGSDVEVALDYVQEHLSGWWDVYFFVENIDWSQELPVWWSLVRHYEHENHYSTTLPYTWHKRPACLGFLLGLSLRNCRKLKRVHALAGFTKLTQLSIENCDSIGELDGLANLIQLRKLSLEKCWSLKSVGALVNLTNLKELSFVGCDSLENMDALANLTNLTRLEIRSCRSLEVQPENPYMSTKEEVQAYLRLL